VPQPSLTVVSPDFSIPTPPIKLGDAGQSLWNRIQTEYAITDAGGVELLAQICGAADTVEALSAQIAQDGAVVRTRTGPKPHPALRDLLNHRAFIARTMTKLGIDVEPVKPMGRPSKPNAWTPENK
jgi:hypothetical protein